MIITTPLGKYQGILEQDVYAFKGIPFAQPPIHEKRFLAPVAIAPHEGVIDATKWQTKAMQHQSDEDEVRASEDCLYLNVWSKNPTGQSKPVVVWIHGGGFTSGTGSDDFLNGQKFVQDD
ncbi:MAG: carboxylesterase family protein, partial [Turicibacter sp.]